MNLNEFLLFYYNLPPHRNFLSRREKEKEKKRYIKFDIFLNNQYLNNKL